jgi:hypothetical protein
VAGRIRSSEKCSDHIGCNIVPQPITCPRIYKTFFYSNFLYDLHRNIEIIMFLGSKVRRVCRADNLTTIYEPIV